MEPVAYLRPRYSRDGAARLLGDVEQAVAAGTELGDRRAVMCQLTSDLHRNHARLEQAIAMLTALGAAHDPEVAHKIELSRELCEGLLGRLGPMLRKADALNALLAVRRSDDPDRETHVDAILPGQ